MAHSPPTLQSQLPNLLPGGSHTHTGTDGHRNAERGFDGNVWARWLVQVVLCGKPGFWWQLASSPALRPLHPALSLYTGSQLSHVTEYHKALFSCQKKRIIIPKVLLKTGCIVTLHRVTTVTCHEISQSLVKFVTRAPSYPTPSPKKPATSL